MSSKVLTRPCPICRDLVFVTQRYNNGYLLASCGHKFRFKKTKSEKIMDRNFIVRPWGLEKVG